MVKALLFNKLRFLLWLPVLWPVWAWGQQSKPIEIDTDFIAELIVPDLLRDDEHNMTINDIVRPAAFPQFIPAKTPHLAFGFDKARWWLHFSLYNKQNKPQTCILRLNRKTFDEFTLWQDGRDSALQEIGGVGEIFDNEKFILINGYYYTLTLQPGENVFWARCRNEIGSMHLTLSVHSIDNFAVFSRQSSLVYGLFLGVMILSLFFSAVMYYFYRNNMYLIYMAYILTILLRESYYNSADFDFLPLFQRYCTSMLIAATYASLFRRFLKLNRIYPMLDQAIRYYAWSALFAAFLVYGLVVYRQTAILKSVFVLINVSNVLFILIALGITIRHFFSSYQARVMLLGSFPLAVAFIIISLRNLSLIPNFAFIQFVVATGFIFEVLVFAIAFTRWYRFVEKDRDVLKMQVSMEAQEKQIAIQAAEQRVKDRIARDLHDDVAASMSSIRILSQIVKRQIAASTPDAVSMVDQITRSAQSTLESIGDIIWAINPHADYLNDVADRIREYAVKTLESQDISFNIDISRNLPAFNLDVEARRNIYLIFKEAINNALKHAQCTHMDIHLTVVERSMTLVIHDNGAGFDAQIIKRGHGLNNMLKRAQDIGGELNIESANGNGTTVSFMLSLPLR